MICLNLTCDVCFNTLAGICLVNVDEIIPHYNYRN